MDPDKAKASLLSLPRELLDHIVGMVDLDDKALQAWELDYEHHSDSTPYGVYRHESLHGRGIEMLSKTSSVLYQAARPYLYSVSRLLLKPSFLSRQANRLVLQSVRGGVRRKYDSETATAMLPLVRKVGIYSSGRDITGKIGRNEVTLESYLSSLQHFPRLESVNICTRRPDELDEILDWKATPRVSYFGEHAGEPYSKYAGMSHLAMLRADAIESLPQTAARVPSWTFEGLPSRHVVDFISLSPSSMTDLNIEFNWGIDRVKPWAHEDAVAEGELPLPSTYDFLAVEHEGAAAALSACTNLRSFSATSLVHERETDSAIHPSISSAFPTSITSLNLTLNVFDTTVLSLLARLPALRRLALCVPVFESDDDPVPVDLPAVTTLELHQQFLNDVVASFEILATPKLETCTVILARCNNDFGQISDDEPASDLERLVEHASKCVELKTVHLKASTRDGILKPQHFRFLKYSLEDLDPPVRLVAHYPPMQTVDIRDRYDVLGALEELLLFAVGRLEAFRREGGDESSTEMREMLRAMAELYKLKQASEVPL
ncbi:hypothetical protein JCM8097_006786 [Rhodosporidiobolus ruineniae]